jgi:hypothetical protein
VARRRTKNAKTGRKAQRTALANWLPSAWTRLQWRKLVDRAPRAVRLGVLVTALAVVALGVNWVYQVARKPSELFFPISGTMYKAPEETWLAYRRLFERHSTDVMTPDLLAALAQIEGSGNPVVRTYWRFSLTHEPFEIFRPASSAVGMYQITDGTFGIARRYCVHRHRVVEEGPWYDFKSCWFNELYTRTVPSHAIEMTSAYLDRGVAEILGRQPQLRATLAQKQTLATMMHLCGAGAAADYARRGLSFSAGQRCGAHDARSYVARVTSMQKRFQTLSRA